MAFLDMVENHKMVVENSGLLSVAALKHLDVEDKKVVSILTGGIWTLLPCPPSFSTDLSRETYIYCFGSSPRQAR